MVMVMVMVMVVVVVVEASYGHRNRWTDMGQGYSAPPQGRDWPVLTADYESPPTLPTNSTYYVCT